MTDSISVSLSHGKEARMCARVRSNECVCRVVSHSIYIYTHREREEDMACKS